MKMFICAALFLPLYVGAASADDLAVWTAPKDPENTEIVLSVQADQALEQYLHENDPTSFAISLDGGGGYAWGYGGYSEQKTLRECRRYLKNEWYGCFVIARGRHIVWPGKIVRQSEFAGRRAQYEANGFHVVSGKFSREIAAADAKGFVGYLAGYGGDAVDDQSADIPDYMYDLNERGWAVGAINVPSGFYLQDETNSPSMAKALQRTVDSLKARGFKKIVLAGQSAGGWQIAFAGQTIEGVSHAILGGPAFQAEDVDANRSKLIPMLKRSRIPNLAVLLFEDDPWSTREGDVDLAEELRKREGGYLIIFHPKGFIGHYSAITSPFSYVFGGCIADFIDNDGQRIDTCDIPEPSLSDHRWMTNRKQMDGTGAILLDDAAVRAKLVGKTVHLATYDAGWEVYFLENQHAARRALIDYGKLKRTISGGLGIAQSGETCFEGEQARCFRLYAWRNGDILFVDPVNGNIYGRSHAILDGNASGL